MTLALVVGACSGEGQESSASPSSAAAAVYAEYLEQAERGGAGAEQLAVLGDAVVTGELTFEAVNELVQAAFACMADAGIGHEEWEPKEVVPGYLIPAYSFDGEAEGMSEDETLAVADACLAEHSFWAEGARADTRSYQDRWDAHVAERLPLIVACLEEHGVQVDPDATTDEVFQAAEQLVAETSHIDDGEGVVMCLEVLR
ncbi:hypothetical protein [Cellulomonas soli]